MGKKSKIKSALKGKQKKQQGRPSAKASKAEVEEAWMEEVHGDAREEDANRLRREAIEHYQRGEHQEFYDKCLQGVLAMPNVLESHRIHLLTGAFLVMKEQGIMEIIWTKKEKTFLQQRFVDNENEPIIYRATAAAGICNICCVKATYGGHIYSEERMDNMARHAMELIERSPPEDDRSMGDFTVKQHLQYLRNVLLYYWTNYFPPDSFEPLSNIWGGDRCDCCGKNAWSTPGGLLKCKRCDLNFYCSKECQVKDWHGGGHNKSCCKKGSIHPGDMMLLKARMVDKPILPHIVKILGPAKEKPGEWVVSPVDGPELDVVEDLMRTVSKKHLSHIRPKCMEDLRSQLIKGRESF